jgi:glycosyltransferase involved in cell wall biosynthesis
MKVSIIMCASDRLRNLKNCLESWTNLTYPDYEFIFIDNASSNRESVAKLTTAFGLRCKNFRFYREPKNIIQNRLWNKYQKLTDGEYVVIAMADEIISSKSILEKMLESPRNVRSTVKTYFLDERMTEWLNDINWQEKPKSIELVPNFWDYKDKGTCNRDKEDASLLTHITGQTRERWDWFGWFRDNPTGHLWLDQDVVIRERALGEVAFTVKDVCCYHQFHQEGVITTAPGYHPRNERQARLLEESERDES